MRSAFIAPAVALALVAVGCSSESDADQAATSTDEGWSYQDATGATISLPEIPTKIVTDAPTASALIPLGIKPVAIWTGGPLDEDLSLAGLDISGIESAGDSWEGPNIETLAAIEPDVIITGWYPLENAYGTISADPPSLIESVKKIAPVVGVLNTQSALAVIEDFTELAETLGAETDSGTVAADKEAFDTAKARFEAAVAAKPDLQVVAVSPDTDSAYVANPPDFPEFLDLADWGLKLYTPTDVVDRGYYSNISWENFASIPSGLVYYDNRFSEATPETLGTGWSVWQSYPAVAAGHTVGWQTQTFNNYPAYTAHLDALSAGIEAV